MNVTANVPAEIRQNRQSMHRWHTHTHVDHACYTPPVKYMRAKANAKLLLAKEQFQHCCSWSREEDLAWDQEGEPFIMLVFSNIKKQH